MSHEKLIVPKSGAITYGSYLKVPELLNLQHPLSRPAQHDETLFIVIHQVYELWFKQILHEIGRAERAVEQDQLMVMIRTLKRVATIQSVLTHQVDVLETMTPTEFNSFRDNLNPASGFQSAQFRELEFRLGAKDAAMINFHRSDAAATKSLEAALAAPTIFDRFLKLMHRRGLNIPQKVLDRATNASHEADPDVTATIVKVYRESERYYDLYSALEALIDLDEGLLLWRYRHVAMVERMIGRRRGTGGSSGVKYLSSTLSKRFFPDIWDARNSLGDGYGGHQPDADSK
jgi:tryptophan 2,3-dioxygenase